MLGKVDTASLERWLSGLSEINNNTKIRLAKTVALFCKFALWEGWVSVDPTVGWKLPPRQLEVPKLLDLDPLADFLATLLLDKNPIAPIVVSSLFAGVGRREGLRRGAGDFNTNRTVATVRGGQAKTHCGRQTPMHPTATAWLEEILPWCAEKFAPYGNDEDANEEWYQQELQAARAKAGSRNGRPTCSGTCSRATTTR